MIIEKIEKKVDNEQFLSALELTAKKFGCEVKGDEITKNDEKYKIEIINKRDHKCGIGGYHLNSISVFKKTPKPKKILETRDYASWTTLSDDSEDYPTGKDHFIALFSEDNLGRDIFDRLKQY